jgi:hypothetical protein
VSRPETLVTSSGQLLESVEHTASPPRREESTTARVESVVPSGPGEETAMYDWRAGQVRYLIHFDDGGSGMRYRAEPLTVGVELTEGELATGSSASSRRRTRARSGTRGSRGFSNS